ncbi:TonB-dependent receptor-like protein [Leeuwenhoekiella aestuarii]|uniref:TonB-dependent receptor-like protein n=1 Tax=Leeuwenhoekiella aestuarii TaxID=2249426 RepID=A0A4Q0NNJ2_9FLAO|nr:TonB-dependent receptor [Leeuwenhoekiella aestuarii]RXG11544.1 TonB-dependent receptor-like protein [Leeuwenhoekiella aestuarii]RXG12061.1 TonB-dependent receptor-like protein [Leeuwenhoekiella aestuarii]
MDRLIKVLNKQGSLWVVGFIFWLCLTNGILAQEHTLSFQIRNSLTNKPIENVQISLNPCSCGGVTDSDGAFNLTLEQDTYTAVVSYIGYKTLKTEIFLNENKTIQLRLSEEQQQLSEVILNAKRVSERLETSQMGAVKLAPAELKKMPAVLGEVDVLRSMTLLPGVNNAGEVSNGLSVRGGSLDQNLVLYDYAPVFNPTHLFGLFSVFTPEALGSIDLYRANIPARYGGRTTSVLDVKVRNPYVDKFKLSGGIGLVSSRLSLETPVIKDKLFLYAGARAGFTDFLLPIVSKRLKNTKARFYDHTIKLLYLPTEKDQISFTNFYSTDFYQLDLIAKIENVNAESNQYDFKTFNNTLQWTHSFNDNSSLRTVFLLSDYTPKTLFPEKERDNTIEYESQINLASIFSEYEKRVTKSLNYYAGIQGNRYKIKPGKLDPGTSEGILSISLDEEKSYEVSAYTNFNWKPIETLTLSGGFRFTNFTFVGPYTAAAFDDSTGEIISTTEFDKGEKVKSYNALEPRLGLNLKLGENTSFKASYARLNQYLQNIYNATTPLPTSRWKTSDANIPPQTSDSYSVGLYQDVLDKRVELGMETYYRSSENNLTYKPGADFFLEEFVERDLVQAKGEAYGVEFSLRKPKGKINGWVNYTWSRSFLKTESEKLADRVNNNAWYPSDFDRPHVFNSTINLEGSKYNTLSFNFTAQTGRPYTTANGYFDIEGIDVPIFLERNNVRLKTYHRLDLSWKVNYSKKLNRRWAGDWTFTIYNIYARKNQYNIYYSQRNGDANANIFRGSPLGSYELTIMNSPIFSLTYNFVFD